MKFYRAIIAFVSIIFSFGYVRFFIKYARGIDISFPYIRAFAIGFAVFIPVWLIWIRRSHFLNTFEHELTHLLFALLSFHKPQRFFVSDYEGGYVQAPGGNFIEYLSPYFFPTFVFILLPISLIINKAYYFYYLVGLGILTSYHIFSNLQEFIRSWTYPGSDITIVGKFFSFIFLIFANIVVYGFLLAFIIGGFKEGWFFLKGGVLEILRFLGH